MSLLIIIVILCLFIALGYFFPKTFALLWILILPLTEPLLYVIIDNDLIPLTIDKIAFATSVGTFLRYINIFLNYFFKVKPIKHIALFYIILILSSTRDAAVITVLISVFKYFTAFVIVLIFVINESRFEKLLNIFMWQIILLSSFVILEYFGFPPINIYTINPELASSILGSAELYEIRSGFYRAQGIDGNSVQSAYRFIMYLPLTIFYFFKSNNFILKVFPFIGVIISIILFQSRTVYFMTFILLVVFFIMNGKNIFNYKLGFFNTLSVILISISSVYFAVFYFSDIFEIIQNSLIYNIELSNLESDVIRGRDQYFSDALLVFLDSFWIGYGSPNYSYSVIDFDDVGSFLIYGLSGGIILMLFYFKMVYSMLKYSFKSFYNLSLDSIRLSHKYYFLSILAATVVTQVNWQEAHFMVLFMIFSMPLALLFHKKYNDLDMI